MAINKYLSLDGLMQYDSLIKAKTDDKLSDKQDKDLIVEFADSERTISTKNIAEIAEAVESGAHVKFFDGEEYLDILECSIEDNSAIFYTDYYINGEWTIKSCVIVGSTVIDNATDKFNYAEKNDLDTKQDILTGVEGQIVQFDENGNPIAADLILATITNETIDAICGGSIEYAEDVMF